MKWYLACVTAGLLFVGCAKAVDPAYLKAHEARAEGVCGCVSAQPKLPTKVVDGAEVYDREEVRKIVDATSACIARFPGISAIPAPDGQPPGLYEEGLDSDSLQGLEAVKKRADDCERIHLDQRREVF